MCGIVGYVGYRDTVPVLINGLSKLEYRGYDSAGIACFDDKRQSIVTVKEKGKLIQLKSRLSGRRIESHIGIGHTRWATHGEPSRANAHPHPDAFGNIAMIANGIIENYAVLKKELIAKKVKFESATDTEVAVKLIGTYYKNSSFVEAFVKGIKRMEGFFAFVAMAQDDPSRLLVYRRSNPICIGLGKGENFVASDVTPLLSYTNRVLYLNDDEYAEVTKDEVTVYSLKTGKRVHVVPTIIKWNLSQAQKGGYRHFMLKEIYEQPQVLSETINKRVEKAGKIFFDSFNSRTKQRLKGIKKVSLVSCGTAYHAGMVGARLIENTVHIPAIAQVASEFRYNDPIVGPNDMIIFITQSGETADTLAALREAKKKGAYTLAIVNVLGSTISREADDVIYTHAGPEIGVASTKAYIAQLAILSLFALYFAHLRNVITAKEYTLLIRAFKRLPAACSKVLRQFKLMNQCAKRLYKSKNFLYLGRGYNFPTALEGALKLKEISYAHAHGYAGGEMKHGPIALIDSRQPVICIAPDSNTYGKMVSNIEEIKARAGIVIAIGTDGDKELKKLARYFFSIPKTPEMFSPILTVILLQILAYKVAVLNGRDVDQPRNLAKSVTVE